MSRKNIFFVLLCVVPFMVFSQDPAPGCIPCRFENFAGIVPPELCLYRDLIMEAHQKDKKEKTPKEQPKKIINEFLLRGPAGTGKAAFAKAFAQSIGAKEFIVDARVLAENKNYHDVPVLKGIDKTYKDALDHYKNTGQPVVIIMKHVEEFTGIPQHMRHDNFRQALKSSNFMLSDHAANPHVIFFLTTDYPRIEGQTVTRTFSIYFTRPDNANRSEIFNHFLKDKKHNLSEETMHKVIQFTQDFAGGDIEQGINYAASIAKEEGVQEIAQEHIWEGLFRAMEHNEQLNTSLLKFNGKRYESLQYYNYRYEKHASPTAIRFFSRLTFGFSNHDIELMMKYANEQAQDEAVNFAHLTKGFWHALRENPRLSKNYFLGMSSATVTTILAILATYIFYKKGWCPSKK